MKVETTDQVLTDLVWQVSQYLGYIKVSHPRADGVLVGDDPLATSDREYMENSLFGVT